MWTALTLVTPATGEPLTLDEAKRQVRRVDDDEDVDLQDLIAEARDYVEADTGRQLLTATYELVLPWWPGWIDIPKAPLQSVTSVKHYDTAGVLQTVAASVYVTQAFSGAYAPRGRISLGYGQVWPTVMERADAVVIRFVAGYGTAAQVPPALKRAMKLLVSHWYEHGEAVITGAIAANELPLGVTSILAKFRTRDIQRVA